jgi:hypothetical protein
VKINKESVGVWVSSVVLTDLVLGFCFLGLMQTLSDPAFGPPLWLKAWAGAYEAWHLPGGLLVARLQSEIGYLGTFAQAWKTPQAQVLRLLLYAANSAFVGLGLHFLFARRDRGAKAPGLQPLLMSRLRQTLFEGQPWRPVPGTVGDELRWLKSLDELEEQVRRVDVDWVGLRDARARILSLWGQAGEEARPWLALGQATLLIAEAGSEMPDAAGVAFGRACLQRVQVLEPENIELWKTLLQWRILPLQALEGASPAVLAGLGPLREIWTLDQSPLAAGDKLAQWEGRWPHATESLRLRAETFETLGRAAEALELWRSLLKGAPSDQRWRRRVIAIFRSQGLPEDQWRLPGPGLALGLAPDWLYQAWQPAPRNPALLRAGRILVWTALLLMAVRPLECLSQPLLQRGSWQGRWLCSDVVSPSGVAIPMGEFPSALQSYLSEEACGYTAITALAPAAAFVLTKDGGYEIYLDKLYSMKWERSAWGVALHLKDYGRGTLNLRNVPGQGKIEMSIPGQTWTLYFMPDDTPPRTAALERTAPPLPLIYETARGAYLNLKERGWVKVGSSVQDLPLYEGVNSDLQPDKDEDAPVVLSAWSSSFTVQDAYQPPKAPPGTCGRCSRANYCAPEQARPIGPVHWLTL